ncbi:MAG: GAF domain-containing protein, partial [Acidimicrobiales bacterium]
MESRSARPQRHLDQLITEIAADLMGIPSTGAKDAMERTLERLLEFFSVDQTFLRRNRLEAGTSVLMAEWPKREVIPVPDPLYEVPFSADPVFGMVASLDRTFIAYPEDSPDYQERVAAGSGQSMTTMAMVPLLREDSTLGVLGLIRHNNERWPEEEVDTLVAIASLIAQMWGRHDAEAHIAHLAYHDEMTQLPNRRLLTERIAEVCTEQSASLLVIDVDNMKVIND